MNSEQDSKRKFIDSLLNFLYPSVESNPEEERRLLEEIGYNYDELSREGLDYVKTIQRRELTQIAREKRKRILSILSHLGSLSADKGSVAVKLREMMSKGDANVQLAFHKLEKLTEDELQVILSDVDALNKINQIIESNDKTADDSD